MTSGRKAKRSIGSPPTKMVIRIQIEEAGKVTKAENITIYQNRIPPNFGLFVDELTKFVETYLENLHKRTIEELS